MKTCTNCNTHKPLDNFGKKKAHKDGLEYWCKECHREYKKSYYVDNLDKAKKERLNWQRKNQFSVLEYNKAYLSNKYKTNLVFRIIKNQRNRIKELLTNKPCSFSKSIGCSTEFLKEHLQSKFQPGMTWNNYGEWHVDHIKPLSKFDLTNIDQFKEACHYINLQPLWAKDNILKSNK